MRAIISAANRESLTELARELQSHHVTVYSTSGTARALRAAGIEAESISTITEFPEILDGRVKTLHPAIFGGILARRDSAAHIDELQQYNITPIDIVVVNLYPFAYTIARSDTTLSEALEQVDIGGVSLLRAAAKNFQDVGVIGAREDYAWLVRLLQEQKGALSLEQRKQMAAKAFRIVADYDLAIMTPGQTLLMDSGRV